MKNNKEKMEKLLLELKNSNYLDMFNDYDFDDMQKSMLLSMIINSLIILRRVDYKLISLLENKINSYKEINNINKDNIYKELMNIIIDYIYGSNRELRQEDIGKNIINNYFTNGYVFHAFNAGLYNEISDNGLKTKDKLIDTQLFKEVREMFRKRDAQVFGLYNPKNKNSIFFAGTLHNIYQYGMGSPSFFRKLIFQSNNDDSYLTRDYDKCRLSIIDTVRKYNLNEKEGKLVMEFFDRYYKMFMESDYCVAMYPYKRNVSTSYDKEDIKKVFKEEMYHDYLVSSNILPSSLIFLSYGEILDIKKRKRKK